MRQSANQPGFNKRLQPVRSGPREAEPHSVAHEQLLRRVGCRRQNSARPRSGQTSDAVRRGIRGRLPDVQHHLPVDDRQGRLLRETVLFGVSTDQYVRSANQQWSHVGAEQSAQGLHEEEASVKYASAQRYLCRNSKLKMIRKHTPANLHINV